MSKPGDLKDRILSAVSIESYIGRFVTLKKQGKYYSGLCPFHQEKSPSFTVTPEKGLFHCFGCGAGGDLFTFVMKKENVDFTGALEILSRYAGIEAAPGQRSDPHKERLYKINETAESMFRKFFLSSEGSESMKYMLNRGIKKETLEVFRIGASPSQWRWLSESLPEARSELLELGLSRENKGSVYDFYRGRVIFPIHDLQGRVAGFGGRILETASADSSDSFKAAKYVNSSESPVFSKSSILYGLWFGLSTVRTEKTVIITEGYLDVIGFHQSGIKNTVAPLGTSLTENHLNLIQRYADSVIIILDGDKAGRAAAYRSAGLLLSQRGLQGSVVILPEV